MRGSSQFKPRFDNTKPKLATSSNLLPYSLISYIGGGNSHIRLLVNNFLIQQTTDGLEISNYKSRKALTFTLKFSSKITPNSQVAFKLEIFTLFLHSRLISIFVARSASRILKFAQKRKAMVARFLVWSYNIFCFVNGDQHGSWWSRWPNSRVRAFYICGVRRIKSIRKWYPPILMSPINGIFPPFQHISCSMVVSCFESCQDFI